MPKYSATASTERRAVSASVIFASTKLPSNIISSPVSSIAFGAGVPATGGIAGEISGAVVPVEQREQLEKRNTAASKNAMKGKRYCDEEIRFGLLNILLPSLKVLLENMRPQGFG